MAMPPSPTASSSIVASRSGTPNPGASVLLVEQHAVESELDEQAPALGEDVLVAGVERRGPRRQLAMRQLARHRPDLGALGRSGRRS